MDISMLADNTPNIPNWADIMGAFGQCAQAIAAALGIVILLFWKTEKRVVKRQEIAEEVWACVLEFRQYISAIRYPVGLDPSGDGQPQGEKIQTIFDRIERGSALLSRMEAVRRKCTIYLGREDRGKKIIAILDELLARKNIIISAAKTYREYFNHNRHIAMSPATQLILEEQLENDTTKVQIDLAVTNMERLLQDLII